jgi:hypothetical protein
MTAKAVDVAREYYRLIHTIAAGPPDKNDPAMVPGEVARKLRSKFPGLSKADMERAVDVMMAQLEMVMEDLQDRLARMRDLARAHLAVGVDVEHAASIRAAFDKAREEFDAVRLDLSPNKLFPKKPDKTKS